MNVSNRLRVGDGVYDHERYQNVIQLWTVDSDHEDLYILAEIRELKLCESMQSLLL